MCTVGTHFIRCNYGMGDIEGYKNSSYGLRTQINENNMLLMCNDIFKRSSIKRELVFIYKILYIIPLLGT